MFSDLRYLQQLGVQVECGCYDCDVTSTQISDDSELDLSLDPSLSAGGRGAACVSVLFVCFCLSVCPFGYGVNKISRIV